MSDLEAAAHARFAALEDTIKADREALHAKFDALLKGLHHLISTGNTDMSKVTDALSASISSLATLASDNATKTTTLIGFKDENDSALSSVLDTIGSASDTMKATSKALDDAIAAHNASDQTGSVTGQAPSNDPGAPITAVVTAPTAAGETTIPVSQVSIGDIVTAVSTATAAGSTVPVVGSSIVDGATVISADPAASTILISQPTTAAHVGDGTEQLTITPPAA